MRTKNGNASDGYTATKRLAREEPNWLPIVKACLEVSKGPNDEFAGSWVLQRIKGKGTKLFPNLKPLVRYGILERIDVTRGGKRAYYRVLDPEAVKRALIEIEKLKEGI